jgi:hypothetical protein
MNDLQACRLAIPAWHRGRQCKQQTTGPPECLAVDLTMLIDAKDLKRSEEVMQHSKSTRAGLTSEVRSV